MNATRQTNTFSGGLSMDVDYSVLKDNQYIYAENIRILEDPTSIGECFDRDDTPYPVPANMIPTIKDMIFTKELNLMLQMPNDTTNNSTNDVKVQ
jgi:hypothetical protein